MSSESEECTQKTTDALIAGKVTDGPQVIYYIKDFITKEEEAYLTSCVYKAPKPKWTQLQNRRLQNWGGVPHNKGMIAEELPKWLQNINNKVAELGVFGEKKPNHVLVNEYLPGQGIMPHLDGPLFYPTITTVNLGSHGILNFYKPIEENNPDSTITDWKTRLEFSLLLEPRSLLILQETCYHNFLHGIEEKECDIISDKVLNIDKCESVKLGDEIGRETRISLTIRHVPKTTKPIFGLRR